MALAECRECKQQASSFAAACPHCGALDPVRKNRPISGFETATVLLLLALLLFIALGPFAGHLVFGPPRWVYAVEFVRDDAADGRLASLGNSGWEIVSARRASTDAASGGAWGYELIVRRPQ